jgi:uncharacterized protein
MSNEKIGETVDFIRKHSHREQQISVAFYGGETLLAQEKIRIFISLLTAELQGSVRYSISTNGYNLFPQTVEWICSVSNLSVNVSLDGNREMHDTFRKNASGHGTYTQITDNLKYFQSKYPDEFTERVHYISTISDLNAYIKLADIWKQDDFLKDNLPISVEVVSGKKSTFKEKALMLNEALRRYKQHNGNDLLVNQLIKITESVKRRNIVDLENGTVTLNNCFSSLYRCFIDVTGDIAPCETICDSFRIGNVKDDFDYGKANEYIKKYTELRTRKCKNCWAFRICKICFTCLDYTDEEMNIFCKNEQEWSFLSLLFLCETAEINSVKKN